MKILKKGYQIKEKLDFVNFLVQGMKFSALHHPARFEIHTKNDGPGRLDKRFAFCD